MLASSRLATLFPALGHDGFVARRWPDRPAVAHGDPTRLGSLNEVKDLGAVLTLAVRSRMHLKAMFHSEAGEPAEVPIAPDDVLSMINVGATIACNELHRWHRGVFEWVEALETELRVPESAGQCNLYLTQPGHGVPMHFDSHEVIVVQVAGRKRWTIAANTTVINPLHNAGRALEGEAARYADGPAPANLRGGKGVVLRPGSVLFLPRGYWHETHALEQSVSLTFGFKTPSWLELLQRHLFSVLSRRAEWRQGVWQGQSDADSRARAAERWDTLRTTLTAELAGLSVDAIVPPMETRDRRPTSPPVRQARRPSSRRARRGSR